MTEPRPCGDRVQDKGFIWVCNKPAGHGAGTQMGSFERVHVYRTPNGESQVSWARE